MTAIVPRVPQEIVDEVMDCLATDPDLRSLQSCALVSKSWVLSCRRHIFHTISFDSWTMTRWLETFPVPEESPAHLIRNLRFQVEGHNTAPKKFFEHTPRFTNVEKMTLLGDGELQSLWIPPYWRSPQSVTSLTINADAVFLGQIRGVIAQLPNLDDLSLSGHVIVIERRTSLGTGTLPRGRFGGQLRLFEGCVSEDILEILMEAPTGVHFTGVQLHVPRERLLLAVRLAEACSQTLMKLSYGISYHRKSCPFSRPSWY